MFLNPRDKPFLKLIAKLFVFTTAGAVYFLSRETFSPIVAAIYLAVLLGVFMGPYILMLHNLTHNPVFKKPYRWVTYALQILMGPFFGQTPFTFLGHHVGMHHIEENRRSDLSSTARYERDRFSHFLFYFVDFFVLGVARTVRYLHRTKKKKFMRLAFAGELTYLVVVGALLYWRPLAAVVLFVIPLVVARLAMIIGNWSQHAFINPAAASHPAGFSITCIDTPYNDHCFNDGYHIEHHANPNLHFTEMHQAFEKNQALYGKLDAISFSGLDYFQVWVCLMTKNHEKLARHLVVFPGRERSLEAKVELLRSRLLPIAQTVGSACIETGAFGRKVI